MLFSRIRTLVAAVVTLALAVSLSAGSGELSGYRFVIVKKPTYKNNQIDIHGLGNYLEARFAGSKSWTVLKSLDDLPPEGSPHEVLICSMSHTFNHGSFTNRASLYFHNVGGKLVHTISKRSTSMGSAKTDVKGAIRKALRHLEVERPTFDPTQVQGPKIDTYDMDEESLIRYLDDKAESLDDLEGIWTESEGHYRVGITRRAGTPIKEYIAFILETDRPLWKPKMVKMKITGTAYDDKFSCKYFMGNHEEVGSIGSLQEGIFSFPVKVNEQDSIISFAKNYPTGKIGSDASNRGTESVASGTGFVSRNNLVVTNYHVIAGADRFECSSESSSATYPLELVLKDTHNDLAILRILPNAQGAYPAIKPLTVTATGATMIGEDAYTVGYPLGDVLGDSLKTTNGVISSRTGIENDPRVFQISIPIQPGNSGGPLLNSRGEVIGVVTSTLSAKYLYQTEGALPQNVNFAIKSDYVLTLLNQVTKKQDEQLDLAELPRIEQIQAIKPAIVRIKAYK